MFFSEKCFTFIIVKLYFIDPINYRLTLYSSKAALKASLHLIKIKFGNVLPYKKYYDVQKDVLGRQK